MVSLQFIAIGVLLSLLKFDHFVYYFYIIFLYLPNMLVLLKICFEMIYIEKRAIQIKLTDLGCPSPAVLTDPETAPEPAKRVSSLWDRKSDGSDSELIFCPPPPRAPSPALLSRELQYDLETFFSPSKQKRVRHSDLDF